LFQQRKRGTDGALDLVGYTDAVKFITTGVILLAAVTLDTVLRRRQAVAGR
jgi:ABC-type xylose transport system permease subunit